MKRYVWWAVIAVALYFAVQGGEYSTRDLYVLRSKAGTLVHDIDSLQRQVDSLTRFLKQGIKANDEAAAVLGAHFGT